MALSKISQNNQTNATWRSRVDAGIDLLNTDILQADTSITVTQSVGEDTTQCVVAGHTNATFNASDYSDNAALTIQTAINSLPKNMSGHSINIIFGTTGGQTITISSQLNINDFTGGAIALKSAKTSDNSTAATTKANTIQSAGGSIDRLFDISRCSEVFVEGLQLIQNTGSGAGSQFVLVSNSCWIDIRYCVITSGGLAEKFTAVLIQRGSTAFINHSYASNAYVVVQVISSSTVSVYNTQYTGVQPSYGIFANNGIAIILGTQIVGSVANYSATNGGLITNKLGLILEETILRADKIVNIAAGSSASTIQGLINDQPKNLNGHSLTFQFADGTYDFDTTQLVFNGFLGGTLNIWGNQSNTLASDGTGLGVKLQSERTGGGGAIYMGKCTRCVIKKIAFEQNGSNADTNLLNIVESSNGVVESCSFNNVSGSANTNDGVLISSSAKATVKSCGFNNLSYNILCRDNSSAHSQSTFTFSGGTDAYRNLRAEGGSIITQDSVQAGGVYSKSANSGAVIFDKDGQTVS